VNVSSCRASASPSRSASACSRKDPGLVGPYGADRGEGASERSDGPEHYGPAAPVCRLPRRPERQPRALRVDLPHHAAEVVGGELDPVGGEGVRLYDVRPGAQVFPVQARHDLGMGQVRAGVGVTVADAALGEQGAHRAVADEYPSLEVQIFVSNGVTSSAQRETQAVFWLLTCISRPRKRSVGSVDASHRVTRPDERNRSVAF